MQWSKLFLRDAVGDGDIFTGKYIPWHAHKKYWNWQDLPNKDFFSILCKNEQSVININFEFIALFFTSFATFV